MASSLPDLGPFHAIVSCFAIHPEDERKRSLCAEIFERLEPGGVFATLEDVASPTARLHRRSTTHLGTDSTGRAPRTASSTSRPGSRWLREVGFEDILARVKKVKAHDLTRQFSSMVNSACRCSGDDVPRLPRSRRSTPSASGRTQSAARCSESVQRGGTIAEPMRSSPAAFRRGSSR